MITEGLLDVVFNLIGAPFSVLDVLDLNLSEVAVLGDALKFGIWVVGIDFFTKFVSIIFGYYTLRLGVGAIEWAWKLVH